MSTTNITILLPAGRLPLQVMNRACELTREYGLSVYLTNEQNLRLLDVPEDKAPEIRQVFMDMGMQLKAPGRFPLPRVCVGQGNCKLGRINPEDISARMVERFSGREIKPKLKIGVAACMFSCSGATVKDIGVVCTKSGFDLYVGGKAGVQPQAGRRVLKGLNEEELLQAIEKVVDFHQERTAKKQRMARLIDEPDFPYPHEV